MTVTPNIGPLPKPVNNTGKPQDSAKTLRSLISGLSDDMAAVLGMGKRADSKPVTGTQASTANRPKQQPGTLPDEASVLSAIAGLIEEEKLARKTKKAGSFSEKLSQFKVLREQLETMKFENPEEQEIVDQFMKNFDAISRQYKRLKSISETIDNLEKKR